MVPYQVLRKLWQMAKYFPANKLQVMLQNPRRVREDVSNARQHGHTYCFAMGLPFVPVFFQSAQMLDDEGKEELMKLISIYKSHREDIFTSMTFPIGEEPNNMSRSGFQMVSTQRDGGHVLLFRELHNPDARRKIVLKFLSGQTIRITDTATQESREVLVGPDGGVDFVIESPADFLLLRYSIL